MDDRMTPMEAEVLEMSLPERVEPQDSYGTAPLPKRKRSHVGFWIGIGLVVIGLCTFSVVATMFEVSLVRNEQGKLILSLGSTPEPTVNQNPVSDLTIPTEGNDSERFPSRSIEEQDAVLLPAARKGEALSATDLYNKVNSGVVCLERETYYGTQYSTGLVISSDGYILTASDGQNETISFHAVLFDGTIASVSMIGEDSVTGICLMKVDAEGLNPLAFEREPELEVGEQIYCIGNPYGTTISNVLYAGMLSGKNSVSLNEESYTLLETSVDLSGLGYGCPVFNAQGNVIGISTAIGTRLLSGGSDPCFGISSADLERILSAITGEDSGSGLWLGFEVEQIPAEYQYLFHYPEGIWISEVDRGTRVYGVLLPNDIILSVNGDNVRTTADYYAALEKSASDGYAVVILYRNGKKYYAEVPLLKR